MNDKQRAFIDHYFANNMNATKAAIAAGYSEKTAYSQGSRLLKHAEVSEAINDRLTEHAMPANEVLYRLAEMARGDIDDVVNAAGEVDMEKARQNHKTHLIKKIRNRQVDNGKFSSAEIEVEMYDAQFALNLLAKAHDLTNTINVEAGIKLYHTVSPDDWDE